MNMRLAIRLILFFALAIALFWAVLNRDAVDPAWIETTLQAHGVWAPVIFIVLFAAATVLFLPGTVFALAGGALFGPVWGTLFNLVGATLGAVLAFLATRMLVSDWVRARTGRRLERLVSGVEREGWRFVAFVRLVPLFPFNLANYAFGLTRIGLPSYAAATFVCMIPGSFAYTYLGYAGREAALGGEGMIGKGLLALALLAVVAFLPRIVASVRKGARLSVADLKRWLDESRDVLVLDVRDEEDFWGAGGHVPGALNIPLADLERRRDELEAWRDRDLAVLCHTDRKSGKAVRWLRAQGFDKVILVDGGMKEWTERGFPLEGTEREAAP